MQLAYHEHWHPISGLARTAIRVGKINSPILLPPLGLNSPHGYGDVAMPRYIMLRSSMPAVMHCINETDHAPRVTISLGTPPLFPARTNHPF